MSEHRDEIVRYVKGAPDVSVTALAERTGLAEDEAGRIVDQLVADGVLHRDGDRFVVVEEAAGESDRPMP